MTIAATLFLLMAVGGAIVGVIVFFVQPANEPLLVSLPVGEYGHPAWPVNPWADRDADVLYERFRGRGEQSLASKEFVNQERARLTARLRELAADPGDAAAREGTRPLILHVTALAAVRGQAVYLLPGDATPDAPAAWLPVDEVLDAVAKSAAPQKFVLLDLAHPVADPYHGVLRDDVAAKLDDLLTARTGAGTLPFPVLTPCGPGELSRPADPARCSAFAYYVAQGLTGLADGYGPGGGRDQHVSAAELAAFVAARVSRYAHMAHNRRQLPKLYNPAAADFPLTYQPNPAPPPDAAKDLYPPALAAGWGERDAARTAGADRGVPAAFAGLTRGLLRAEQVWRSADGDGRAGRADEKWRRAKTAWDKDSRDSGGPAPAADSYRDAVKAAGPFRLAATRADRKPVPADWAAAFAQYVAARLAAPPKPDEVAKLRQAWLDKAAADPHDAAWVVWEHATRQGDPPAEVVRAWADAVNDVGPPQPTAEVLLLRAVGTRDFRRRQELARFPGTAVAALVQAEHEVGLTVAVPPEGFLLVRDKLAAAEANRVNGARGLFAAGTVAEVDRAEEALRRAATGFREAREVLARWQDAHRAWEAVPPALHDALPAAVGSNRPPLDDCEQLAADAALLADKLAAAARGGRFDPTAVTAYVATVRRRVGPLRTAFDAAAVKKAVEGEKRTTAAQLVPLYELVGGTGVVAADRKRLWDAVRGDAADLHDEVRKSDLADEAENAVTAPSPAAAGEEPEEKRADRRVRASLALLRLAGYDKLAAAEPVAKRHDADPAAAGDRLRAAWGNDLPAAARAAEAGDPFAAERIARAYPPQAAAPPDLRPGLWGARAAADARAYREWVRDQLLADKPLRTGVDGAEPFYPAVADLAPN